MTKDPNDVKVLAFKSSVYADRKKPVHKSDTYDDAPPGNNTPNEVRAAQRNLLACGMETHEVHYHSSVGKEGLIVLLDSVSETMKDVLEMITPNTAYMTGPPSMGQIKETFGDSGLSREERDRYWEGQRGGHET